MEHYLCQSRVLHGSEDVSHEDHHIFKSSFKQLDERQMTWILVKL